MPKITAYRNIALDDLVIGMAVARVSNVGEGIDELARSIERMGLLQPIVVCKARDEGKWEIIAGQRRFLAYRKLKRESILAGVIDERLELHEAKAISIAENVVRGRRVR